MPVEAGDLPPLVCPQQLPQVEVVEPMKVGLYRLEAFLTVFAELEEADDFPMSLLPMCSP